MASDYAFIYEKYGCVYARCGLATATFPTRIYGTINRGIAAARRWAYDHGATHAEIRTKDANYTERLDRT
jgi:hypothetical protein